MLTRDDPHVQAFLDHLQHERRLSVNTIKNYRADLDRLIGFCQTRDIATWQRLDSQTVRVFVSFLHQKKLSGRSIQRALSASRMFFRYLIREGERDVNPAEQIPAPKSARRLPRSLTVDQMSQLLTSPAADPKHDLLICRDQAMLELMYSCGLRLSELTGLDTDDLDLPEQLVRVTGKGAKTRVVPVGSHAVRALTDWLAQRHHIVKDKESAVFVGARGSRLSARAVQQRVTAWARRQGLDQPVHPHMLRHSFASHLLESSGNLRAVQELLGHADISTTQVYTHLDFQHLAKVYDKAHPRARKKRKTRI